RSLPAGEVPGAGRETEDGAAGMAREVPRPRSRNTEGHREIARAESAAMVEVRGFKEGLEDVVAAESGICFIDGDRGILSYRGIDIHQLADSSTFEEVCFLLWEGRLPRAAELA